MSSMRRSRQPEESWAGHAIPLFDLFFDLPHPAASAGAERARIIEPPDASNPEVFAELYEATNISRIARFAFPEHDDQKQATQFSYQRTTHRSSSRGDAMCLNQYDVYYNEFTSERHTFSLQLSDNRTQLNGHVLRYLPSHRDAQSRADVGRRGARAMVLLTQAPGGDRFFEAILKTLVAVLLQGDAREKAMQLLHGLHRGHAKQYANVMDKLCRLQDGPSREAAAGDTFLSLPGVECPSTHRSRTRGWVLPGDFVKYQLPPSLQVGFQMGLSPDDYEAPILPLIRCLGAVHTLRLISALLCERRVILVSKSAARLSACVRGASAVLAQGMLQWQNIFIPVLPPHLLKYLIAGSPYLIGVLEQHLSEVERLMRLKDVLCVHIDRNLLRTFEMANPVKVIPDMLAQPLGNSKQATPAEILQNDIDQILKVEKRIFGEGTDGKATSLEDMPSSRHVTRPVGSESHGASKKTGLFGKKAKNASEGGFTTKSGHDIASLFGKVMRGDSLREDENDRPAAREDDMKQFYCEYDKPNGKRGGGEVPKNLEADDEWESTSGLCDNERGEEGVRAALTAFFLTTHGDLGELLSEDPRDGTFLLDRRKYIKSKRKEQGLKEQTPMFLLYIQFSGTAMLEQHLQLRLAEYQRRASLQMARHMSLFSVCEKHLRLKRIKFTFANIRRVISKSAFSSPMHASVERSEKARARAMALTSSQPFDGNMSQALTSVISDCHDCKVVLPQTMAVVWSRFDDFKGCTTRHKLLGLHLLKNLVLHGPVTILSFALDGVAKLIRLTTYATSKGAESDEEIRESAKQILDVVVNHPLLFLSRRRAIAIRANLLDYQGNLRLPSKASLRRVKSGKRFQEYHKMLRPPAVTAAIPIHSERVARSRPSKGEQPNRRASGERTPYKKPERRLSGDVGRGDSTRSKGTQRSKPDPEKRLSSYSERANRSTAKNTSKSREASGQASKPEKRGSGSERRRRERPVRRMSSPHDSVGPTRVPARRRSSFSGGFDRSAY